MRLRKQLLLLSLITLILPWAGCQYLSEFQHAIEQGQAQALSATAKAVAARIQSDPVTLHEIQKSHTNSKIESLFSYRFKTAPIIDGYDEEWLAESLKPLTLKTLKKTSSQEEVNSASAFAAQAIAGLFNGKLNIFMYIQDDEIHYFNPTSQRKGNRNTPFLSSTKPPRIEQSGLKPSKLEPSKYDNTKLYIKNNSTNEIQIYEVAAAGPGNVIVQTYNKGIRRIEHQIKGKWLENSSGYQLELEMPEAWGKNGLLIEVNNAEKNLSRTMASIPFEMSPESKTELNTQLGTFVPETHLPPVISQSTVLDEALSVFLRDDLSFTITNNQEHFIGRATSLQSKKNNTLPWIIQIIYQAILERSDLEISNINDKNNVSTTIERSGTRKTMTAKEAMVVDGKTLGFVNVKQHLDSLSSATNEAFSRLILYSIIATLIVTIVLIFYASWLSFRIHSLSLAAQKALSDKGTISTEFPEFKIKDEVAELSNNYAELLNRLKEYTRYLQTLSSKLSHELRTPLAIVSSSLDNLSLEKLDNTQAQTYALRAQSGAKRLSAILTAMGSASRIEQSIESAETIDFDLMDILPDLTAAYRSAYPNIQIVLNTPDPTTPIKIHGVPELIVQMLDKLIDNAADFCTQGEVLINVEMADSCVALSVHNQGPLLPEHMSAQLFDSLVSLREHKPNPQSSLGTPESLVNSSDSPSHLGLGLFIVRLIVECHKGRIEAKNLDNGSGVAFTAFLPVKKLNH